MIEKDKTPKQHPLIFVCYNCDKEVQPKHRDWVRACRELGIDGWHIEKTPSTMALLCGECEL